VAREQSTGSRHTLADGIAKLAVVRRQELNALAALSSSPGRQTKLDSFVAVQRQRISLAVAEAKRSPKQPASAQMDTLSRKSTQLVKEIGFRRCP
jgi:hypothetical protein